jgi:hypothetical protein
LIYPGNWLRFSKYNSTPCHLNNTRVGGGCVGWGAAGVPPPPPPAIQYKELQHQIFGANFSNIGSVYCTVYTVHTESCPMTVLIIVHMAIDFQCLLSVKSRLLAFLKSAYVLLITNFALFSFKSHPSTSLSRFSDLSLCMYPTLRSLCYL